MNKPVAVLVGIAMLIAPTLPTLAQSQDGDRSTSNGDDADGNATRAGSSYRGQYWSLDADPDLPGARNLTLANGSAPLAASIELPGSGLDWRYRDDRARLTTSRALLQVEDDPDRELRLAVDDETPARIVLADTVTVENASDDDEPRYNLTLENGLRLRLTGDDVTRTQEGFEVFDGLRLSGMSSSQEQPEDEDGSETREDRSEPEEERDRETRENRTRDSPEQRGDQEREDRADRDRQAHTGPYEVGSVTFTLGNDTLRDVRLRNTTVFSSVDVPGLMPAEEQKRGPQLRLDGQQARVRLVASEGLMARIEADEGLTARLGPDVEVDSRGEDELFLSAGNLVVVLQGDDLQLEEDRITADELRFNARTHERPEDPVWQQRATQARGPADLPYSFEGRYVAFQLHEGGLSNVSVHGTPLGDVAFPVSGVEEFRDRGSRLHAEGEAFELEVADTPAVQLEIEADEGLALDLPASTTLPSGARVDVRVEEDELRLQVRQPDDVLSNRTFVEHRPAEVPVERTEGPSPGLRTRTEGGEFGITSSDPSTLAAQFQGELDGTRGNVSLQFGLARAMLISDTNGNGRVDVGEPAVAESSLSNGTTDVEGDVLVSRFPLWSGSLSLTVEPGNETAKVTYEAHNLSAPPGTLFVLETRLEAPPGAQLEPTDTGVEIRNGSLTAAYSAAGPVTVDGADAWAQRSIFVDSNDTVRVLLAYPAGDDIVHDPTLAIQSVGPAEVAQRLAASPYAILVGAGLAGLLVAGTVARRRAERP